MRITALIALLLCPIAFADVKLTDKSSVDDVLKAMQQRGQNLNDFSANVRHESVDPLAGRPTVMTGKIFYQRLPDGDARIRVIFERKKSGAQPEVNWHREYLLEKGTLTDMDFDGKSVVHRQVLKPGEKMNPLKLGEGPFPLPIGQDPAEVKKNFDVSIVPPAKDDPANTIHVQLKPVKGTRFADKYELMEVWVDKDTNFTPRIRGTEKDESHILTTDLSDIRVNSGLKDSDFKLPPPGRDWSVSNEALGVKPTLPPRPIRQSV